MNCSKFTTEVLKITTIACGGKGENSIQIMAIMLLSVNVKMSRDLFEGRGAYMIRYDYFEKGGTADASK